jgi:ribosomal-protein-alanine N-acetyltransferase
VSTWIETPRLVIRTLEPRDAEVWVAMVNDPEVRRYLPPTPEATMQTFAEALERRLAMESETGYAMWAVDDKATSAFVGQCGIRPVQEGDEPEIELVYHYPRTSWNRGYGTEAAIAVLAYGLGQVGLDRIMAIAMSENTGSWRVMEKAGMRYEGLVNYYGLVGLKKYVADREWRRPTHDRAE